VSIRAVFLDIGETLFDETRNWSLLADWLDIPRLTVFSVMGGLIAEGVDHRNCLKALRPDLDWNETITRFRQEVDDCYLGGDLYPDAVPCLHNLVDRKYFVGIAGNQPAKREHELRMMNLPLDMIRTSGGWGVAKPDARFFANVVSESGFQAREIVYVGDRIDNDIVPAAECGLIPIHLARGPWGNIQKDHPGANLARARISSLTELPNALESL
jgi:FMN phosphatase YigB (HAD superfamily)